MIRTGSQGKQVPTCVVRGSRVERFHFMSGREWVLACMAAGAIVLSARAHSRPFSLGAQTAAFIAGPARKILTRSSTASDCPRSVVP